MDAKTDRTDRILDELIRFGGERALAEYSDERRQTWEQQSLYLSYLREHGGQVKAALEAGLNPTLVAEWEAGNIEGFLRRVEQAREEVGYGLLDTLYQRLRSGELKAIGHWNLALRALLPRIFDKPDTSDSTEGRELIKMLRDTNQAFREFNEASDLIPPLVAIEEDDEEKEVEGGAPIIDITTRMKH